MNEQQTTEAKMYKALDKLEAVIQHNESPLDTWAENEFELNKVYGNGCQKYECSEAEYAACGQDKAIV